MTLVVGGLHTGVGGCLVSGAEVAEAVDEELVAGGSEAAREIGLELNAAAFKFKQLPALIALEVMVMVFAGDLIASGVSGHGDGDQPAFFGQLMNGAIDRGNGEAEHILLGESERFLVREGTIGGEECGANRFFLSGVAKLHGHRWVLETSLEELRASLKRESKKRQRRVCSLTGKHRLRRFVASVSMEKRLESFPERLVHR